jgi:hypothetical protein
VANPKSYSPNNHTLAPAERQWRSALGLVLPMGIALAPAFLSLGSVPLCAFKHLTGMPCPLCGGIRSCAALAQGDVAAAWALNPGLLPLLVLAGLHSGLLVAEAITGRRLVPAGALRSAWKIAVGFLLVTWVIQLMRLAHWV